MHEEFSMNYAELANAAGEMKSRVSGMVAQSFAAAPAAAKATAGATMNYATGLALVASFGQIAMAIKTLTERANEHAKLIETSAQAVKDSDAMRAAKEFNAETILPPKRSTGSTHA